MATETENVKVFIRIRPQQDSTEPSPVLTSSSHTIKASRGRSTKSFRFNKIFHHKSSQIEVYRAVASPIVDRAFDGYNGTIFAYGQSGTGKTYTMLGDLSKPDLKGIIPNVFSHIFAQISLSNHHASYALTVTFLEIYNEQVRDLLSGAQRRLEVRESPDLGVYVKDLSGFAVESMDQVTDIIARGTKNRSTGSTRLNDQSSRSHAIFTISVEARRQQDNSTTFGKLNLVDLAGSERVSKSFACGDRLKEAGKINLSLSVLGNVISALVDGKTSHIPYRNSKLTRLLQDSLGGSSLTAMLATVSPNQEDLEETCYTLMYADRVKHITNRLKKNEEGKSVLKTFEAKIEELQRQLNTLSSQKHPNSKISKELTQVDEQKRDLLEKINTIQNKILIGGENLLEKAQLQLDLLEGTAKELKILDSSHQLLQEVLQSKNDEKKAIEEQYLTLEEQDKALDREIEETERMLSKAKKVVLNKESEYQNEIGHLLYTNKCLAKDMTLVKFIINEYIPVEYQAKLDQQMVWDESMQEWRVKFVPYGGNNLHKSKGKSKKVVFSDSTKNTYKDYKQ